MFTLIYTKVIKWSFHCQTFLQIPIKPMSNHKGSERFPFGSQENEQPNHKPSNSLHNCIGSVAPMPRGDKANNSFLFGTYNTAYNIKQQHQNELLPINDKSVEPLVKLSKNHLKDRSPKEKEKEKDKEGGTVSSAGGKFSVLQKWLRGDDKTNEKKSSPGRLITI